MNEITILTKVNMKFKPEITEQIIKYVAAGSYKIVAAQACGITEKTLYEWIKEGEKDIENEIETDKSKFCESIKKAESEAELRNVGIIQKAALDTWQASAWMLERKHYKRWGRKDRHEVTGKDGDPLIVQFPEELKGIMEVDGDKSKTE